MHTVTERDKNGENKTNYHLERFYSSVLREENSSVILNVSSRPSRWPKYSVEWTGLTVDQTHHRPDTDTIIS